jgi:pSer/pThr/pTyr-binding forkhead associated (FHA) protein
MQAPGSGEATPTSERRKRLVVARVLKGRAREAEKRFTASFTIGRDAGCGLQILEDGVAPRHVQVMFDGIQWWVRDLESAAGSFKDGRRIQVVPLADDLTIELGRSGSLISLGLSEVAPEESASAPKPSGDAGGWPAPLSEAQIIERYLRPASGATAGKQTMMFRRAFEQVHRRSFRRYRILVAAVLVVLAGAGGVIAYQRQKLHKLQATAERLFYTMKTFELRAAQLEELVMLNADPGQVAALGESREKLKHMESEYDAFVRELGAYGRVSERQRYILRVARRFGECEVNIPGEFISEVEHYIERWRPNERLANALRRARQNGYGVVITRAFTQGNLPPQYVYLALVESNFDERAVGKPTRYGFAKGMWQFISLTGHQYGLKIGPLYEQPVYDPGDDRFDWPKATRAAVKYIRKLTTTEAQASGLLAMASYNWGEDNVRGIIASMPENPRERNFWQLLAHHDVPAETYDYVLSIFSAAVICENPGFFGFDVECPISPQPRIDELGRDRVK